MAYKPQWLLKGKPYAVQLEAMRRSHGHDRFAHFCEMGLGKSALVLAELAERYLEDCPTVIVVAPNSFKIDWSLAPAEWGLNLPTKIWPQDEPTPGKPGAPVMLVFNFEAVRSSAFDKIRAIMDKHPCVLVVDESSAIKNFKSLTAKSVLDLSKRAKIVRLLNGTPLTQNVMDLFPQLKCVGELDKINPYAFRNRFAVLGGYMGRVITGTKNEDELHEIQSRCSFRALKKDWRADLPDKTFVTLHLEMTKNQQKHYKEMLDEFYTVVKGHEYTAEIVLTRLDKLRQVSSGLLIDGDKHQFLDAPKDNPKIKAALEVINSGSGKLIVSYWYKQMGRALHEEFTRNLLRPAHLWGQMKPSEVKEQKDMFNNDPGCRVLVAQVSATRFGHTLIGQPGNDRCSRIFWHDHTFSFGDRSQMNDRIHRGEQDQPCMYYDPVLSPVDQAQLNAIQKKGDLARAIVDAVRATAGERASRRG